MALPRVLVIDDDPGVQGVLRAYLEGEGYRVLSAAATLDPVDISQLRPTIINLDAWLGGRATGWDVLQTLNVIPGARSIPVMLCTEDDALVQREAERLGILAAGVLRKPFALNDVVAHAVAAGVPGTTSTRI